MNPRIFDSLVKSLGSTNYQDVDTGAAVTSAVSISIHDIFSKPSIPREGRDPEIIRNPLGENIRERLDERHSTELFDFLDRIYQVHQKITDAAITAEQAQEELREIADIYIDGKDKVICTVNISDPAKNNCNNRNDLNINNFALAFQEVFRMIEPSNLVNLAERSSGEGGQLQAKENLRTAYEQFLLSKEQRTNPDKYEARLVGDDYLDKLQKNAALLQKIIPEKKVAKSKTSMHALFSKSTGEDKPDLLTQHMKALLGQIRVAEKDFRNLLKASLYDGSTADQLDTAIYNHYKENFLAGYQETYHKIMELQHYLEPKAMGQLAMINNNLKLNDTLRTKEISSEEIDLLISQRNSPTPQSSK